MKPIYSFIKLVLPFPVAQLLLTALYERFEERNIIAKDSTVSWILSFPSSDSVPCPRTVALSRRLRHPMYRIPENSSEFNLQEPKVAPQLNCLPGPQYIVTVAIILYLIWLKERVLASKIIELLKPQKPMLMIPKATVQSPCCPCAVPKTAWEAHIQSHWASHRASHLPKTGRC